MEVVNETQIHPAGTRWKWLALLALLIVAATLAIYYQVPARAQELLKAVPDWLKTLGLWGPVVFILLYVVSCVAIVPASILTLGAGAIFGVVKGFIFVSIGATLGATAAFLIGRHLARDWVERKVAAHPKFAAIERAVTDEGWRIVLLTRLCPLFPFFLLNYAYGLTRISLLQYVWATWLGIIPGSLLFVYIGSLANTAHRGNTTADWLKTGFVLITAVLAAVHITKVARRALAQKINSHGPSKSESDATV
jgi:uncharacterized membrane protein YdjX (TVP38/TMEM64 family)